MMLTNLELLDATKLADHIRRALNMPTTREAAQRNHLLDGLHEIHNALRNIGTGGRQKDERRVRAVVRLIDSVRPYAAEDWRVVALLNDLHAHVADGDIRLARRALAKHLGIEGGAS